MRAWVLLAVFAGAGCRRDVETVPLISEVRRALAEREQRLHTYHLVAESREGGAAATHAFFFRSPNRMRGVVLEPARLEWSFDGERLYKLEAGRKTFSTFELKLPVEKAAMFLNATFTPFVSEGFRAPLMPSKGLKAAKVRHPKGPDAVELRVELGPQLAVTYLLRWPGADFLGRRTESPGHVDELRVEEEHCDAKLGLCVPSLTTETLDGVLQLTTRLTTLELNPELPADDFTPAVPAGWTTESHPVVESG